MLDLSLAVKGGKLGRVRPGQELEGLCTGWDLPRAAKQLERKQDLL